MVMPYRRIRKGLEGRIANLPSIKICQESSQEECTMKIDNN